MSDLEITETNGNTIILRKGIILDIKEFIVHEDYSATLVCDVIEEKDDDYNH